MLKPFVDAGVVRCARGADCLFAENGVGGLIAPGSEWHLGHDDEDRSRYKGAEHAKCNLRAGGKAGARKTNARRRRRTSRAW
jgi:hypothetical protein